LFPFGLGAATNLPGVASLLPRFDVMVTTASAKEGAMKIATSLLAKFGLFAPKADLPDPFALRLERINMRENRRTIRLSLFRAWHRPLAA
jgi:hypothetical protein